MLRSAYLPGVFVVGALATLGCRGETDTSTTSSSTGGQSSTGGGGVGGDAAGSGGGVAGCEGPVATIDGVTTGAFGVGAKISVNGVVAMSQKFLVSKSSTSNNCLWGVFVSSPGLTETQADSGMIVLSYGTKATTGTDGKTYCSKLGQEPVGDKIPDNVKPGDVLDLVGVVSRFPDDPQCTAPDPVNKVGMLQLGQVCKATITGTAPVPTPHTLTPTEVTSLSSTTDQAFHDKWGAVKVRTSGAVEPQGGMVVGDFGVITLTNGVHIGDKVYYRGYSQNKCNDGPVFTDPAMTFTRVDGFHYLDYCTWGMQVDDKCADYDPQSGDCTSATCPPDMLPGG